MLAAAVTSSRSPSKQGAGQKAMNQEEAQQPRPFSIAESPVLANMFTSQLSLQV